MQEFLYLHLGESDRRETQFDLYLVIHLEGIPDLSEMRNLGSGGRWREHGGWLVDNGL